MITGWLDCGGPLLDTSASGQVLVLECPGCGYHTTWQPTDDPARPGDTEDM